jgi:hypothetical protein
MNEQDKVSLSNLPADVPTEAVPLPSLGKVYPTGSSLAAASRVEIRSMTAKEEDILTSRALLKQGKAMDALLKSCILDKNVSVGQLLTGDRNAILFAIRVTGYGPEYTIRVECPKCEEGSEHQFDLSTLEIKPLEVDPVVPGKNEFAVILPVTKKKVTFKLNTGDDERELSETLERQKKLGTGETAVTTRLLMSVLSVDGETDKSKFSKFIQNMPARDSRFLRSEIDRISPGVKMEQKFQCPNCNEESEVNVPIGTEFFWPRV